MKIHAFYRCTFKGKSNQLTKIQHTGDTESLDRCGLQQQNLNKQKCKEKIPHTGDTNSLNRCG